MRFVRAACLATGLTMVAVPARTDPPAHDGEVTVYRAALPESGRSGTVATVVIDSATGKPIEGASVLGYADDIDTRHFEYGNVLVEAKTDALGVASFQIESREIGHWIVRAPGFAPLHFGYLQEVSPLVRGREFRFRLVDLFGAPVANAPLTRTPGTAAPTRRRRGRASRTRTASR